MAIIVTPFAVSVKMGVASEVFELVGVPKA